MTENEPEDVLDSETDDEQVGDSGKIGEGNEKKRRPPIAPTSGNPPKRHRKLTSKVWQSFEMLDELDNNGQLQAKCKGCGAKYCGESKHGTGNMIRHLKTCKGKTVRDIGQYYLHTNVNGSLESSVPKFDPDVFRELLASAIAKHNLPLQLAEYEGIRACFAYLCPDVKFFSRNTIKAEIIKMYEKEKLKLMNVLQRSIGRIALTSDCWTSITTDGYMSLTAHYVDDKWRLNKRIISFSFLPPPHTGAALAEKVNDLLKQWGIEKRIVSITLDNASSNDALVDGLRYDLELFADGDYFHVRCCAHILNLIVQESLKELDEAVYKVRESVKYCKGSQGRKQRFKHCVDHVSLAGARGLRQDVPTRWNSTYAMLDSALYYKKAFLHLQKTDANYINCPTVEEWVKVEKICKFLKVFYDVTCAFSGSKYPTSNLYFPNVLKIRLLLKENLDSNDRFMKNMAVKMSTKFDKYWKEFSTIMGIVVVFDPRYKLQVIEWAYNKIYGEENTQFGSFKEKLFSLFNEYARAHSASTSMQSPVAENVVRQEQDGDYMNDFDSYSSISVCTTAKSQLDIYLEEPKLPRTSELDVLEHWKTHQYRYPLLALMARDILAVPISTVASESAFSIGGRILDPYRSSLKPSTVESLVCLRDWVFAKGAAIQPDVEELCNVVMDSKVGGENDDVVASESVTPHTQSSNLANN